MTLAKRWALAEAKARSMVTLLSVITIDMLRTGNDRKASKLYWSRWLRLAGRIGGGE
jgi:hypothetical protein